MSKIKSFMCIMLCTFVLVSILSSCNIRANSFSELKNGENFYHNIDGHYKKLPKNYCLSIILGGETSLMKFPEYLVNEKLGSNDEIISLHRIDKILEAHYIKGYFNDLYLILCEETTENHYTYISFNFDTEEIVQYSDENDLYDVFSFESNQWFSLCNTYEQMKK